MKNQHVSEINICDLVTKLNTESADEGEDKTFSHLMKGAV